MSDHGPHRPIEPAELAKIERLWRRGVSAFHIATTLRLAYGLVNDQVATLEENETAVPP